MNYNDIKFDNLPEWVNGWFSSQTSSSPVQQQNARRRQEAEQKRQEKEAKGEYTGYPYDYRFAMMNNNLAELIRSLYTDDEQDIVMPYSKKLSQELDVPPTLYVTYVPIEDPYNQQIDITPKSFKKIYYAR